MFRNTRNSDDLRLPFPFNLIPYIVIGGFIATFGLIVFAAVTIGSKVNEEGGVGRALGSFMADVQDGMNRAPRGAP